MVNYIHVENAIPIKMLSNAYSRGYSKQKMVDFLDEGRKMCASSSKVTFSIYKRSNILQSNRS
jgi:hypothetical protein